MHFITFLFFLPVLVVLAAPEGYKYKEPALRHEQSDANAFQPIVVSDLSCKNLESGTDNLHVINSQTIGRIVNQQQQQNYHGQVTGKLQTHNYNPVPHVIPTQLYHHSQEINEQSGEALNTLTPPSVQLPINYSPAVQPAAQVPVPSFNNAPNTDRTPAYFYQQTAGHSQSVDLNNQQHYFVAGAGSQQQQQQQQQHHQQQANKGLLNPISTSNLPIQTNIISNHKYEHSFGSANSLLPHVTNNLNTVPGFGFDNSPLRPLDGQLSQIIKETYSTAPLDPTIEKHIYVHVPPEELEEANHLKLQPQSLPTAPKKHYKIIFIKAPSVSTSSHYAHLAAAAAPQVEEKTLVYVLAKKPDEPSAEFLQQLQQTAYKTNKPEVYFIKYKSHNEQKINSALNVGGGGDAANNRFALNSNTFTDIRTNSESNNVDVSVTSSSLTDDLKHKVYGVPLQ
uniref:DM5 domain-containing protein n=1 Tax=Glossina brevipalpis TaxID=37001 RepID=A0A1A9W2R6_9MUSC